MEGRGKGRGRGRGRGVKAGPFQLGPQGLAQQQGPAAQPPLVPLPPQKLVLTEVSTILSSIGFPIPLCNAITNTEQLHKTQDFLLLQKDRMS